MYPETYVLPPPENDAFQKLFLAISIIPRILGPLP